MALFRRNGLALILSCMVLALAAQPIPVEDGALAAKYPFVSTYINRLTATNQLDPFFKKLATLKQSKTGQVTIVHIGDSHLQPDFLTGVVRKKLQQQFGDAGRGLVFPYQLAHSNSPDDIRSQSGIPWEYNRLAHPEIEHPTGITGFGIRSMADSVSLTLQYRAIDSFSRIRVFAGDQQTTWTMDAMTDTIGPEGIASGNLFCLAMPVNQVVFTATGNRTDKQFYGASLEKHAAGVLYHCIGVNGARYDQFNGASRFWEQLPLLKADLYIVSLGTNEAQRAALHTGTFVTELEGMVNRLRNTSPGAVVILTTAPDSYKRGRSNAVLRQVNDAIKGFCSSHDIPLWDLYHITNGYGSARTWAQRGLMARDRVHFTSAGYQLMGSLLYSAIAKAYNAYEAAVRP